jgi:hypothetical protein
MDQLKKMWLVIFGLLLVACYPDLREETAALQGDLTAAQSKLAQIASERDGLEQALAATEERAAELDAAVNEKDTAIRLAQADLVKEQTAHTQDVNAAMDLLMCAQAPIPFDYSDTSDRAIRAQVMHLVEELYGPGSASGYGYFLEWIDSPDLGVELTYESEEGDIGVFLFLTFGKLSDNRYGEGKINGVFWLNANCWLDYEQLAAPEETSGTDSQTSAQASGGSEGAVCDLNGLVINVGRIIYNPSGGIFQLNSNCEWVHLGEVPDVPECLFDGARPNRPGCGNGPSDMLSVDNGTQACQAAKGTLESAYASLAQYYADANNYPEGSEDLFRAGLAVAWASAYLVCR